LRWTALIKHGVQSEQEEVLAYLRQIARALTADVFESAVETLKSSTVWLQNKQLQHWFGKTWLPEHKVGQCSVTTKTFRL
jgi:hypothetical protein